MSDPHKKFLLLFGHAQTPDQILEAIQDAHNKLHETNDQNDRAEGDADGSTDPQTPDTQR